LIERRRIAFARELQATFGWKINFSGSLQIFLSKKCLIHPNELVSFGKFMRALGILATEELLTRSSYHIGGQTYIMMFVLSADPVRLVIEAMPLSMPCSQYFNLFLSKACFTDGAWTWLGPSLQVTEATPTYWSA
jgi:hypothetical protein